MNRLMTAILSTHELNTIYCTLRYTNT